MGLEQRFPDDHAGVCRRCHAAGQKRPTPLLLQYGAGDYNCLHQDVYGELVFPLQVAFLLSRPGEDFSGGEFVLTEQRPRMQSRAEGVPLSRGEGVIFPVHHRPVQGTRGVYRVNMRPRGQSLAFRPGVTRSGSSSTTEVAAAKPLALARGESLFSPHVFAPNSDDPKANIEPSSTSTKRTRKQACRRSRRTQPRARSRAASRRSSVSPGSRRPRPASTA
jgi:hypothetical protein